MRTLISKFPTPLSPIVTGFGMPKNGKNELRIIQHQFRRHVKTGARLSESPRFICCSQKDGNEEPQDSVQELMVPSHWLEPSKASEESEWLRVTLHKWLDDEYCPEATNIEISKVAADSFYKSLMEKQTDLGEILLKMAVDLESISYQDSFHGAFSSANAAVNLILQRILEG